MLLVVSQLIGIAAVGLYLLSYQLKKRIHIVWVTCISNGLYVLQYILLGAFSGAIMDFLSTVSSFFAGKKNSLQFKKHAKVIAVVNMLVITAAGLGIAIVRHDPVELLPIAGALLQTGGLWCENEQTIRKFGLCSAPFWLIYNYISQAYGAALGSVIAIVSIIIAMVRYRKKGRDDFVAE
ncbi:MAG: YgjV family protein [Acutalibacteraceae bacterium]|nr:YgjV family protein [Acutalibacteraceae bacterium]